MITNAIQIIGDDPEPRMRASILARLLSFRKARDLVSLAERHSESVIKLGRVCTVRTRPEGGGHEWEEPLWNEAQCLYLCCKSETPVANEITVRVIQLFEQYRRGLATAPRMLLRAIDVAAETVIRPFRVRMDRIECEHEYLKEKVENQDRKPFSKKSLDTWFIVIHVYCAGFCPSCSDEKIIIDGKLVGAHADHWFKKRKNGVHQGWYVCVRCNNRFEHDTGFKQSKEPQFRVFQDHVKQVLKQLDLPF